MPTLTTTGTPRSPLRLPTRSADGTTRADADGTMRRLIHRDGRPIVLAVHRHDEDRFELTAAADALPDAEFGLARARFWTGIDDDLSPFLERFADDPRIGRSVREAPWLRPYRRPVPFDVLLGAVCEQLVTDERGRAIKRAIVDAHGPRHDGLRDVPEAATVAALAPAQLERCGLAAKRARTLIAVAAEVAAGRVDLLGGDPAAGWRRLRAITGVGPWTVSTLALHGQGHPDALPAGDHAYRTLVARELGRPPGSTAEEAEVVAFFTPYAGWRGVAGWHLLRSARRDGATAPRRPALEA